MRWLAPAAGDLLMREWPQGTDRMITHGATMRHWISRSPTPPRFPAALSVSNLIRVVCEFEAILMPRAT